MSLRCPVSLRLLRPRDRGGEEWGPCVGRGGREQLVPLRLFWVISWASARSLVTPQWDQCGEAPLLSGQGNIGPSLRSSPTECGAAVHGHHVRRARPASRLLSAARVPPLSASTLCTFRKCRSQEGSEGGDCQMLGGSGDCTGGSLGLHGSLNCMQYFDNNDVFKCPKTSIKCESSHPELAGSEPLGRGWAAETDCQLGFWCSALLFPVLGTGLTPWVQQCWDLLGDGVGRWVEFEAGGPQAPPRGRLCHHTGRASLPGALPAHCVGNRSLVLVSQGSWGRSSFLLQPRMIG